MMESSDLNPLPIKPTLDQASVQLPDLGLSNVQLDMPLVFDSRVNYDENRQISSPGEQQEEQNQSGKSEPLLSQTREESVMFGLFTKEQSNEVSVIRPLSSALLKEHEAVTVAEHIMEPKAECARVETDTFTSSVEMRDRITPENFIITKPSVIMSPVEQNILTIRPQYDDIPSGMTTETTKVLDTPVTDTLTATVAKENDIILGTSEVSEVCATEKECVKSEFIAAEQNEITKTGISTLGIPVPVIFDEHGKATTEITQTKVDSIMVATGEQDNETPLPTENKVPVVFYESVKPIEVESSMLKQSEPTDEYNTMKPVPSEKSVPGISTFGELSKQPEVEIPVLRETPLIFSEPTKEIVCKPSKQTESESMESARQHPLLFGILSAEENKRARPENPKPELPVIKDIASGSLITKTFFPMQDIKRIHPEISGEIEKSPVALWERGVENLKNKEISEEPMEIDQSIHQTQMSSEKLKMLNRETRAQDAVDKSVVLGLLEDDIPTSHSKLPLKLGLLEGNEKQTRTENPLLSEINLNKNIDQEMEINKEPTLRLSLLSDDTSKHLLSEQSLSLSLLSGDQSKPLSTGPNSTMGSLDSRSELIPPIPCFEDDTRSSWNFDASKTSIMKEIPKNIDEDAQTSMHASTKETMLSEKPLDDDSRLSIGSQKSLLKRRLSDDESSHYFPADRLFEYQWPAGKGEFYLLQEHVSEFLSIKSFKRKYPDFSRRPVDIDERKFLQERGVVSEMQCDLGLTAVRSDDVLELMSKDYPDKYQEYLQFLQEKERQKISNKHKEYSNALVDKTKINDFMKKAINSAAEYNAHLNQDRREERKTSFDLQTYTVHIPSSKIVKLDKEATKVGNYPISLLPGQYQDSYRVYSSEELKYFPLNTVLYGPLKELSTVYTQPSSDGSQSDSEDSCASGSCCSSSQETHDGSADSSSSSEQPRSNKSRSDIFGETPYKPKDKPNAQCKVCHSSSDRNKEGRPEELVHCSECESSGHPSCLDLTPEMVAMVKTYPWQCMDCKTCMLCMDPYDEDKMMFCDKCDRGYHTFCVGLKSIPNGRWICQLCGQCASCGSRNPGPEGSKAQWHQEIIRAATPSGDPMKQLFCVTCVKQKKHR